MAGMLLATALPSPPSLAAGCTIAKVAEFPVTMTNMQPLMTAKINDVDVHLIIDSGAFYSMIGPASAAELHLSTYPAPFGFYVMGVGGGRASASIARVKTFTLAGVPLHNIDFLVGGSEFGGSSIGVLGQNVLHLADVEYDLGQGMVRLIKPKDCSKATLAYWATAATPLSTLPIEPTTAQSPHTLGSAFINGVSIRVLFDTGAGSSVLSLKAAGKAGVTPNSPGTADGGWSYGIGKTTVHGYIARFSSFKIGDEEIRNARLRIADIDLPNADMLIGPDFFLSHRVYVANSQHRLYFSYNGGPVFNLSGANHPAASATPAGDADGTGAAPAGTDAAPASAATAEAPASASPVTQAKTSAGEAGDAADFSRRGEVAASRHDFAQALQELTRACELAPGNAAYFYQRGIVYWQMHQGRKAMTDFDQALTLEPQNVMARLSRAELLLQAGDRDRAVSDLDAVDTVAAQPADVRLMMARLYERADRLAAAVREFDLWIAAHEEDARLPAALNGRCWARALADVDLPLALKDCNAALKRAPKASELYGRVSTSRGLVFLRLGRCDDAVADWDAAVKWIPKDAWSWYGRGICKLRKQQTAAGEADIAQAKALWPAVADEFDRRGIRNPGAAPN